MTDNYNETGSSFNFELKEMNHNYLLVLGFSTLAFIAVFYAAYLAAVRCCRKNMNKIASKIERSRMEEWFLSMTGKDGYISDYEFQNVLVSKIRSPHKCTLSEHRDESSVILNDLDSMVEYRSFSSREAYRPKRSETNFSIEAETPEQFVALCKEFVRANGGVKGFQFIEEEMNRDYSPAVSFKKGKDYWLVQAESKEGLLVGARRVYLDTAVSLDLDNARIGLFERGISVISECSHSRSRRSLLKVSYSRISEREEENSEEVSTPEPASTPDSLPSDDNPSPDLDSIDGKVKLKHVAFKRIDEANRAFNNL